MADDRANQQEDHLLKDQRRRDGKRSIEETKGRNMDLRLIQSGWRSDERHEINSRSWPEKKDKEGQIRDYRDSYNTDTRENQQQQRLRDAEMQRRRYETESRMWREEMDRSADLRRRYDETASDWGESKSEWRYDKITGRRYELLQSGEFRVHPGKKDCYSYFQTGTCLHGTSCRFKHPTTLPQDIPKKTYDVPVCKHFLSGYCKKGSECDFPHTMERDGAEPMPQARSMDWRASGSEWEFDERIERRYETESGYRPEKRSRTIPDSRPPDRRGIFEDIRQRRPEIEPGYEQERREIPENRFMAAQRARENMQEQRSGGRIIDLSHLINPISERILRERMRKTEIDRQRREESPISPIRRNDANQTVITRTRV